MLHTVMHFTAKHIGLLQGVRRLSYIFHEFRNEM